MIIAISSQKGGTGKSTTAINLADGLSRNDRKVLLIDMDPQANLSQSLGIDEPDYTIEDWLLQKKSLDETVVKYSNMLDIIPADIYFDENKIDNLNLLKKVIDKIKNNYDYILLDLPPHLGVLTLNGYVAATDVFTTVKCDILSYISTEKKLTKLINEVKSKYNKTLKLSGIIPTFYYSNIILTQQVLDKLNEKYGDIVFPPVRKNITLAECPYYQKTIFEYSPNSHGAKDYKKIVENILERE